MKFNYLCLKPNFIPKTEKHAEHKRIMTAPVCRSFPARTAEFISLLKWLGKT